MGVKITMTKNKSRKMGLGNKLAIFNTIVWLGVLIFCLIAWIKTRTYPEALFNVVSAQYSVCLVAYMGKSGYENRDVKTSPYYTMNETMTSENLTTTPATIQYTPEQFQ